MQLNSAGISILKKFKETADFSEKELELIFKRFESKHLQKKTPLLAAGKVAKEIYFIEKGCIRLFYLKDGRDISAYFFTDGMFAGAYDSFISRQPSQHHLEALEECTVLSISYKGWNTLFSEVPSINAFALKVLEERFISLHQLFTSQILDSPEERYINLQRSRPDLLERVPQHQIATYLGVTPVSLSRIRNRVVKRR